MIRRIVLMLAGLALAAAPLAVTAASSSAATAAPVSVAAPATMAIHAAHEGLNAPPPPCNSGFGVMYDGNTDYLKYNGHGNQISVTSSGGACLETTNCEDHGTNLYCELVNQDSLCADVGSDSLVYAESCVSGDHSEEFALFNCNSSGFCIWQNYATTKNLTAEGGNGAGVEVAGGGRTNDNEWFF